MSHTQQANKENKNKRASTEHAKSAYVTQQTNNQKTKTKEPQ